MEEAVEERLTLARHYLAVDQPRRALETLAQAGGSSLEDAEYWEIRAAALHDLDRYDEACEAARKGLALDPDDLGLLDVVALSELELDHQAEAMAAIDAALELWPEHPTLLAHRALILARFDRLVEAEVVVGKAMAVAPGDPAVLRVRAQVAYLAGKHHEATQYADELLAAEPDSGLSHILRGNVEVKGQRFKQALRHFEEAARLNPEHPEIAEVVRESRVGAHPVLAPVRPIWRFGRFRSWLVFFTLAAVLAAAGQQEIRAVVIGIWFAIVVLSWTAPPLLRRWYGRRRRGF